jgi:prepilin-type N-terminal cleavage/methylation domain-containing protein
MQVRSNIGPATNGFTIIEVVLALVVIALLAAGFMAAGMESTGAAVVASADILRAHLGFAQSLAMANNTAAWSVAFSGNSYALLRDGNPSPIPWPGETNVPPHVHRLPGGVGVAVIAPAVVLDGWGAPAADYPITLSDGTVSEQIVITHFTGLVR